MIERWMASYWWLCVLMKPGMTIMPRQSTTLALLALMLGRIATIFLPSMSTSAFSKSPTAGSSVRTTAFFSRMRSL